MDNTTNATETIVDKDKDMAQESTEQKVETEKAEPEAAPEEIPEELKGVSEEVAREVMKEAKAEQPKEAEDEDVPDADADSDTKHVPEEIPTQKIPYDRFKKQVDKTHDLEAQIADLKAKLEAKPAQVQQPQMTAQVPAAQSNVPPAPVQQPIPLQLNQQTLAQIEAATTQQAMQMTGMTQADVDALEYADEKDPKMVSWKAAKDIAKNNVYSSIRQEIAQRQKSANEFLQRHQEAVQGFQTFYQTETAEPDFKAISDFATGEHFTKLPPAEQNVIRDAYARVERNTASPQDIFCVTKYYSDAKQAYRSEHPLAPAAAPAAAPITNNNANKQHPRSEQVSGSASLDGGRFSVPALEKMLAEKNFQDLPPNVQHLLKYGRSE